jgi:hypothetical protein
MKINETQVGFEVLTAVSTKMAVFWVVVLAASIIRAIDDGGSKDL